MSMGSTMMRPRAALALMAGAVVACLVPSLLTTAADPSGTVAVALALGIAAVVRLGSRHAVIAFATEPATVSSDDVRAPTLSGRITDPVHHPLRPRAPGPV